MIQLHTFGDAMIRVGEKEVRPSAPVLFAALLFMCVERGRRVPRAALQELLFPEKDERSGAHSVRQLLYKLRTLGVPLEMAGAHTALPADSVVEVEEAGGEMLPGYAPQLSAAFADWVARYRSQRLADARSRLLRELTTARSAGDAAATAKLAASLLSIDPLNEEATCAKAEALAVAGQKHQAVQLLQEYGDEVESVSPSLRLPADLLRRRIAERFADGPRTDPPLLGRAKELAMLLGHFERASSGRATMSLVWGEAGIGKTRLVQEFRAHVSLRKAVVVTTHCQPHDTSRPMGALVDLVPRLLQFRGALGIAPEAMRVLRGLLGSEPLSTTFEPEVVAARVRLALEELVLSIASEAPLVLIVEDAHWQDEASTSFLRSLLTRDCQLHIVLTSRTSDLARNGTSSHAFAIRLESLERPDALQLLQAAVGSRSTISDELRDRCIDLAAGHPLFICSIAEYLRVSATAPSTSTTLRDLLRRRLQALSPQALLLLRCVAAYSNLCTLARARLSLGMPLGEAMLAIQDLAERGLITQDGEITRCSHDLLAEAVLADMPQATRAAVMEQVAVVLEEEGTTSRQASLLWACAECWVQAGRSSRAASAFRRCAEFAMAIGESGFAIQAMEKAQSCCAEQELEECIEDTIRIADESVQVQACTRNIDRLNRHRVRLGLPPTDSALVAFATVNARRRELIPVWSERVKLERLVFDETARASDRIRAARAFIAEAEENLEATACRRFYEQS
ncbi:MAG TPA: AAA family ATPase, partial [Gemmatimonadaceae bacterium]|nr:AAA family ATPase [Gemmatimonadaceae bacterium]